jgi:hypothetical protein
LNYPFLQSARTNLLLLLVLDPGDFLLSLSPLSSSLEREEILFSSLLPPFFLPVRSSSCPVCGVRTPTLSPLPPAAVPPRRRTRSTPSNRTGPAHKSHIYARLRRIGVCHRKQSACCNPSLPTRLLTVSGASANHKTDSNASKHTFASETLISSQLDNTNKTLIPSPETPTSHPPAH